MADSSINLVKHASDSVDQKQFPEQQLQQQQHHQLQQQQHHQLQQLQILIGGRKVFTLGSCLFRPDGWTMIRKSSSTTQLLNDVILRPQPSIFFYYRYAEDVVVFE